MGDRSEAGPSLTIRRASAADHPFVIGCGAAAFTRFGDYGPILRGFLEIPGVTCFIAEIAGKPVGFALIEGLFAPEGIADLLAIAVEPRHRRAGVGRALLSSVIAGCEGPRSPRVMVLTVAEDNDAAIALFRSHGFEMVPGSPGRYAGGQRSRRMARASLRL